MLGLVEARLRELLYNPAHIPFPTARAILSDHYLLAGTEFRQLIEKVLAFPLSPSPPPSNFTPLPTIANPPCTPIFHMYPSPLSLSLWTMPTLART